MLKVLYSEFGLNMKRVPEDFRGVVTGFMVLLSKGLLDDDRWDWDVEQFEWQLYQAGFSDPTVLRTTLSVFLNNLRFDSNEAVINYQDARFRRFQYFRAMVDSTYPLDHVSPPFSPAELDEPDWGIWEA